MRYFPFFFDLRAKHILVIGGGLQASSKVRLMARTEAEITVVSPDINEDLAAFVAKGRVSWLRRKFSLGDLADKHLLYAATASDAQNAEFASQARARGILVAAVDQAEASDILTPAIIDRDPLVVAIGTEGNSPVLAREVKARIDAALPSHLGRLAAWTGAWRTRLAAVRTTSRERRLFWRDFFQHASPFSRAPLGDNELENLAEDLLRRSEAKAAKALLFATDQTELARLDAQAKDTFHHADTVIFDPDTPPEWLELARREARFVCAPGREALLAMIAEEMALGHTLVRLIVGEEAKAAAEAAELCEQGFAVTLIGADADLSSTPGLGLSDPLTENPGPEATLH